MIYHCQGELTITPPLDLTRAQIYDLPLSRGPNHYTTVRSDQGSNP